MSLSYLKISRNVSLLIALIISIGISVIYNNASMLSKIDDRFALIAVITNLLFWSLWAMNSSKVQEVEAILAFKPNARRVAIKSGQYALYSFTCLLACLICVIIAMIFYV